VKLSSRTVRLVHREAAGALLACQVLLALGAQAVRRRRARRGQAPACSARKVLLAVRDELGTARRRCGGRGYSGACGRRGGRSGRGGAAPRVCREWVRRVPHKPPKPPILLPFTDKQKARISRLKRAKK